MTARPGVPLGVPEPLAITRVEPGEWRRACQEAIALGARFEGIFAAARPDEDQLRAVFSAPGGEHVISCGAYKLAVETIVDVVPAAAWDEREAHDLHGVRFVGHEPLRPLLDHDAPLDAWTVPVVGHGTHQVAVGPVHAGVIESGHFRFHVVGERILHVDLRLFYKRRGLEAAAAGRPLGEAIAYVQRACAACSVANAVAYVQACEAALGLRPDRELCRVRTLLLELERVYNHLHDISAICAGVGFGAGTSAYAALKERAQRVNEQLARHRFLFGKIALGGSELTLDARDAAAARAELLAIQANHVVGWRELQFALSVQERLADVGVLSREDAERLGAVGPVARASGLRHDVRCASPRLWYGGFAPAIAQSPTGDVASRMAQRAIELAQSFRLLDELLAGPVSRGRALPNGDDAGADIGVGRVESPRGATTCVIERDGSHLRRMHLRTGSYANWPVLASVIPGNLLADFPLINKSFELCYACVDR